MKSASLPTQRWLNLDALAVLLLVALWLLFFWRLFTPIEADQASLKQGDFSGQFVAFAAYQYERFSQGQIPLWNPYNNGGLPFIADTQAAVFYPPRLLSLAIANLLGGFSYRTLEWEMTAHVLLYTLLMYLFIRRLTIGQRGSRIAAIVAALVGGYGGFFTGYAPLQLAILEAGTWLPLALLGTHYATRASTQYPALALTGFALGMSWMAGHPQTSFFMTWLLLGYFAFGVFQGGWSWRRFIGGSAFFGLIAFGLSAVQLLPGLEYLRLTTRSGFGFEAKGNGFPIQDIVQFFVPTVVSLFSPLYIGVIGILLALIALWRRSAEAIFWGAAALVALLWSFGANSLLYPLLYNTLPGAYFFRGQERAAFIVANAGAILAALGVIRLMTWKALPGASPGRTLRRMLWLIALVLGSVFAIIFVAWLGNRDTYSSYIPFFALSAIVAIVAAILLPQLTRHKTAPFALALIALTVFELFTVGMDSDAVYDPTPPAQQLSLTPPPLVPQVLDDTATLSRVDGFRGLGDNFGSLYGVADIRGISPLWLGSAYAIVEGDLPDQIAWELFSVRYVFTDWNELPIPSEIVGRGTDRFGSINLHQLSNPRPFALLISEYEVVPDDVAARARLADPAFNPRTTLLLNSNPSITTGSTSETPIAVSQVTPEEIHLSMSSPVETLVSISMVDYPGWRATINDQPTDILRAYGGLMALRVMPGESTIHLTYDPLSYRIGALLSLVSWSAIAILGCVTLLKLRSR